MRLEISGRVNYRTFEDVRFEISLEDPPEAEEPYEVVDASVNSTGRRSYLSLEVILESL